MLNEVEIRKCIMSEIKNLIGTSYVGPITDDMKLNANLHMTSLQVARLVAVLEGKIGIDPFTEYTAITSIRSVGDLIGAYVGCASGEKSTEAVSELEQAALRARSRR